MKPHKRNGREAKLRRQGSAKDRQDKNRELLKEIFKKEKS
jgi:hypothetical protein